jgi:hypothetical protein
VNGREVQTVGDLVAAVTAAQRWQVVIERQGRRIVAQL